MYRDTVTLFNFYSSRTYGDLWYPTVLRFADLNIDKAAIVAKYGEGSADSASVHIRYTSSDDGITVGSKIWLPPKEWKNQVNDMLPLTLTFSDDDILFAGDWGNEDVIVDSEENYADGFFTYAARRFDYVFKISTVAKYSVIPHFEILAK